MRTLAAAALLSASVAGDLQPPQPFIPVGVVVGPATSVSANRRDLQDLARRRFNVIGVRDAATGELRLYTLARLLRQASFQPAASIPASGVEVVDVRRATSGKDVRRGAWLAIARGARGVVFDGAPALLQDPDTFEAAAAFADNVTRNAALFAALQPRVSKTDVRVDVGPSVIDARFLESAAALVLVAVNLTPSVQRATMTFAHEMPEAIWQNMETGGAVNFVASPDGPTYPRTFTPHDVVVLMIRKQYR